jgi:hypothetical protein
MCAYVFAKHQHVGHNAYGYEPSYQDVFMCFCETLYEPSYEMCAYVFAKHQHTG